MKQIELMSELTLKEQVSINGGCFSCWDPTTPKPGFPGDIPIKWPDIFGTSTIDIWCNY